MKRFGLIFSAHHSERCLEINHRIRIIGTILWPTSLEIIERSARMEILPHKHLISVDLW